MINKKYLDSIGQIKKAFYSDKNLPSIQLFDFLDKKSYGDLKRTIRSIKLIKKIQPMQYSYDEAEIKFIEEISDFIYLIFKKQMRNARLLCFEWKDYMILNDEVLEKPGIDVIFDLSDGWNESFGGSIVYVDSTGEYTKIPASGNSLIIVERKKNTQKFVKYVNHLAPEKRCFILGIFSEN